VQKNTKAIIKPPFFEIGPKQYIYGDAILELAKIADEASQRHNVQVIFTPPFPDIRMVAESTRKAIMSVLMPVAVKTINSTAG